MRQLISLSVFFAALLSIAVTVEPAHAQASAETEETWVTATGKADAKLINAKEDAYNDALRRCIEAGGVKKVYGQTQTEDAQLVVDRIYTDVEGYMTDIHRVVPDETGDGEYRVRLKARVIRGGAIEKDAMALRALIMKQKERPRMVVICGSEGVPLDFDARGIIRGMLRDRHFDTLYESNVDANRRRDADAMACKDPKAAAHMMAEQNADYYVVAIANITNGPPEDMGAAGRSTPYHAVATISIFARDTSRLCAETRFQCDFNYSGTDTQDLKNRLLHIAITKAMEKGIGSTVKDWWHTDTQEIELLLVRFPFAKVADLVANLRKIDKVDAVIASSTDAEGRGHVRVVTQLSAADVAALLIQIDPTLVVKSSSAFQLTVDGTAAVEQETHPLKKILAFIGAGVVALVAMILGIGAWMRRRIVGSPIPRAHAMPSTPTPDDDTSARL